MQPSASVPCARSRRLAPRVSHSGRVRLNGWQAGTDAQGTFSGSVPALHLRVLPLVRRRAVQALGSGRACPAGRSRLELRSAARCVRLRLDSGSGTACALDEERRRGGDQRQLVGKRQRHDRLVTTLMDVMAASRSSRRLSIWNLSESPRGRSTRATSST
jgi:hypothetical protein